MALGQLNLRVGKQDFLDRIEIVDLKMANLADIIEKYGDAKNNLNQFIEEGDSTYEAWCERIDTNVKNCKKAYALLKETRQSLQTTVDQMDNMSGELKQTVSAATEAAKSVIDTTLKVNEVL